MTNRRQFLSQSVGAGTVITMGAMAPEFLLEAAQASAPASKEQVLVVIQLSGGNDGLNTVIPFTDPLYYKNRPKLGIPKSDVLKINKQLGFHSALAGFSELLEANQLTVLQGIGYPNPNRSHFESMDIWHSCFRKDKSRNAGWLGRYLDQEAKKKAFHDVPALHLGSEKQPLALAALNVRVPSVRSLAQFRLQDAGNPKLRGRVESLTKVKRSEQGGLLDFVHSSTSSALSASQRVEAATKNRKSTVDYPDTPLAGKLKHVASLIAAGLATRIYYVQLDGFDTHSRQPDAHAGLLRQLSGGVTAFMKDLKQLGQQDRVLTLCFSEFGRRVKENASSGTDHGAAAPVFVVGSRTKAGVQGAHPKLNDLTDGDLKHHTDFRQVYAALLEQWLGVASEPIIGGRFKPMPLTASS